MTSIVPGKSYSPLINKNMKSIGMNKKNWKQKTHWLNDKMGNLYDCEDKLKVKIDGKCVDYKNKKAQKRMLDLLNYRNMKTIPVDYVIGPAQKLSNCWLNSFFMCYFISDKGRKFFRHFRRIMITGEISGGRKVEEKYRKGLWLLNKTIQASLLNFYSNSDLKNNAEKFIIHADTNNIIRLLRGDGVGSQRKIMKTKIPSNPLSFYKILFSILGITNGVDWINVYDKQTYKKLFGKSTVDKKLENSEVIVLERRDDATKDEINSKRDKVVKEFTYGKSKFVLDSAVLRSTNKKHFTSYVTIGKQGYAFEGGAYRRMRPMNEWKDILISGQDKTWNFGSPIRDSYPSQKKEGYELTEKFNFTKGYQILFYYRV